MSHEQPKKIFKMSQEQPRRPENEDQAIKYMHKFSMGGELAGQPGAPWDALTRKTAEMGHTPKDQAAVALQSPATGNDQTDLPGRRLLTEAIGGQVVGEINQRAGLQAMTPPSTFLQASASGTGITIGEALEATALTAGSKPVGWSDAAAIQAAEVRASGRTTIAPGGVAAAAQSAATHNARVTKDEEKTTLAQVLADATSKLPADRPATRKDAEGVAGAEMRNDPNLTTDPSGVSASVAAAARINQSTYNNKKTS